MWSRRTRCSCVSLSWKSTRAKPSVSQLRHASQLAHNEIDTKWQHRWSEQAQRRPKSGRKSYVLPMFAYPSGSLHMGHLRVYTISDVIARYRRMRGDDVLHPTGWDAFGLPAENAAIERGLDPAVWTKENIAKMKAQLKSMNTSFDWAAEISTCDPSFSKHTQRLFLMLYERGLAYQADALVNWDPVDQTVLANEQVDSNGRSWRSGAVVEQKNLRQWFFRISAYKEALLSDLDGLSRHRQWPERVITQQRNWIGKSSGARLRIDVQHPDSTISHHYVFTTRPETIFGAKYLAVSLAHDLSEAYKSELPALQALIDQGISRGDESKDGVKLPLMARIPSLGQDFNLSVFAAPYVLDSYGEGAVMGVPAHDSRDLAFWKQNGTDQEIPIVVLHPDTGNGKHSHVLPSELKEAYTAPGILTDQCGKYAGMDSVSAAERIVEDLSIMGDEGSKYAYHYDTWRLRDWLVSRQRYWGTPIPIVHCRSCGAVAVPENELPVELPKLQDAMKGRRGNPLESIAEWVNVPCPGCGKPAERETDTMDTFVDSSWYYGRFVDPDNSAELFSKAAAQKMLPVDTYVGGVEHAILHLLYARFIYKFLYAAGLVPDHVSNTEPFQQLIAQGMVHGKTLSDPENGRFLKADEVEDSDRGPIMKVNGKLANISWEKMSKSKHNGIDPSVCISKYGADAVRAHILFAAPVSEVLQWDEEKIIGIQRWFNRIRRLVSSISAISDSVGQVYRLPDDHSLSGLHENDASILLETQSTIDKITKTFEQDTYSLNTTISDLIKLTNLVDDVGVPKLDKNVAVLAVQTLLRMIAPITPAFAEECWEAALPSISSSVLDEAWPVAIITTEQGAQLKASKTTMICAVQVNGKLRFTTDVPTMSEKEAKRKTTSDERIQEVIDAVLKTEQGQLWFQEKNLWADRKRVVVVGGGKLLSVRF